MHIIIFNNLKNKEKKEEEEEESMYIYRKLLRQAYIALNTTLVIICTVVNLRNVFPICHSFR